MAEQHCCEIKFWVYLVIVSCLVLFAGLMSGLTLGLMSLGLVDLEVLMKSGSPQDQKHAAKIYPVVKNQHLLLCTLLLGNALAMEALPIFLDSLVNAWGAILISVTMILMFGEIFPQAICSRYGLAVGAVMTPLVRVLVILFFPITYPISKLLDYLLGKSHLALFRRAELLTLVHMHGNEAGKGGELTHDETTIITGALELTQKAAKDAMTPIDSVFSVDVNANLDMKTVHLIMSEGHSRVPVYMGTPKDIVGLILVKNILTIRPEDNLPLKQITTIRRMPRVEENMPLYDILNEFQKGHSHMAAVVRYSKEKKEASNRSKSGVRLGERRLSSLRQAKVSQGVPMAVTLDISEDDDSAEDRSVIFLQKDPVVVSKSDDKGAREHGTQRGRRRERNDPGALLDVGEGAVMSFDDEEIVGIITMEDVIEELLQEEILDETDEYIDVHKTIKVNLLPHGGVQPPQQSRSSSTATSPPLPNAAVTTLSSFPQSSEPPAKTLESNPFRRTVTQSQALMSSLAVPQYMLSNAWPQQPKVVLHSLKSTG